MPRSYTTLTLDDAKRMLAAAEVKAESFGIAYNIAVVDAGGHLLAFARQDGALIGSIDLAIDKAATARIFDKATSDLARMSQPGAPLYGIQETNVGKVVIFGGGHPGHVERKHRRRRTSKRGDRRAGCSRCRGGDSRAWTRASEVMVTTSRRDIPT